MDSARPHGPGRIGPCRAAGGLVRLAQGGALPPCVRFTVCFHFPLESLSFPGHLKGRVAGGYGARVDPVTIVFSKNQMPFLTSICCLDIVRTHGNNVQLHGAPLFYGGALLSL